MSASTYSGRAFGRGDDGAVVKTIQRVLNRHGWKLAVDGDFGPATERAVRVFQTHHKLVADGEVGRRTWAALFDEPLAKVAARTLAQKAHDQAVRLIGVMEHGGNNLGAEVTTIIRANAGTGPEPWCGDFMAYCYRKAGSKSVTRAWAAVRLYLPLTGLRRTSKPRSGDIVRFTFDHVGMFEKDNGNGTITTIEGNTGAIGAVSDSITGGDGVYRKVRSKTLVRDYIAVGA